MTDRTRLDDAARADRIAQLAARRTRAALAEAVYSEVRAGRHPAELARAIGRGEEDLSQMLTEHARRLSARQYQQRRYERVKAGEIEPYHGTTEGVAVGCRCERCEEYRDKARPVKRRYESRHYAEVMAGAVEPWHGSRESEVSDCQCDRCEQYRAKKRAREAARRSRKKGTTAAIQPAD